MEIWKKIEKTGELYEVSNLGNIRSYAKGDNRILRQSKHKGYFVVGLKESGKRKYKVVHRLVAEAFITNPNKKPLVDHINGDRFNNNVLNLRWVTHSENAINTNTKREYIYPIFTTEELKNETWKLVTFLGKSNLYVSDLGRIKYLEKYGRDSRYEKESIKVLGSTEKSYPEFSFQKDDKTYSRIKVHIMVWKTFKGEYDKLLQVNHINNDKSNNRLNNLNLMTPSQNIKHNHLTGNFNKCEFYSEVKINNILNDYYFGELSIDQLNPKYRIANEDLIEILNGTNPNVNYNFKQKMLTSHYKKFHSYKRLVSRDKNKTFENYQKIFDSYTMGFTFSKISKEYGISAGAIKHIVSRNKFYKDLMSFINQTRELYLN